MGLIVGMDEAGYGPNLGPLVITASVWRVPGEPRRFDLWNLLKGIVSQTPVSGSNRIHIADSKEVYSPSRGLVPLERSIQTVFGLSELRTESFRSLCNGLMNPESSRGPHGLNCEPWFADRDLELPAHSDEEELPELRRRLNRVCTDADIELVSVRSDVVLTERFNEISSRFNSKGAALSRLTLSLLRSVWDPDSDEQTLIIGDKHGGRSRYDELLDEQLDGQMIFRIVEGRQKSSYRVGKTELHFQQGAEEHFPVAVSSMVCKYVRELSMELFNQFWQERIPDLKPTKGYPVDAKRFRAEIAETQKELRIPDSTLWRSR